MLRELFCQSCKGYVYTVGEVVKVDLKTTTLRFACPLCKSGLDLVTKVSKHGAVKK